jgi:hypothetical protein
MRLDARIPGAIAEIPIEERCPSCAMLKKAAALHALSGQCRQWAVPQGPRRRRAAGLLAGRFHSGWRYTVRSRSRHLRLGRLLGAAAQRFGTRDLKGRPIVRSRAPPQRSDAEAFRSQVLQLYTIDGGELSPCPRRTTVLARRSRLRRRNDIAIFGGNAPCCVFLETPTRKP